MITSSGQSKKKAKQTAALAALKTLAERLNDKIGLEYVASQSKSARETDGEVTGGSGDAADLDSTGGESEVNPVGRLQEICMRNRWRPPNYDTTEEMGLPHERHFTMICQVDCDGTKIKSRGSGRSKKQAKRSAASEMIALLESEGRVQPATGGTLPASLQTKERLQKISNDHVIKSTDYLTSGTFYAGQKVVDFMKSLGDELNHELDNLFAEDTDPHQMLETAADFLECSVQILDVPNRVTDAPFHSVLVNLTPLDNFHTPIPIVTGWGTGVSRDEAIRDAAKTSIKLLKEVRWTV